MGRFKSLLGLVALFVTASHIIILSLKGLHDPLMAFCHKDTGRYSSFQLSAECLHIYNSSEDKNPKNPPS